jgi:hypothetical protein
MRWQVAGGLASLALVLGCNGSDALTTGSITPTADGGVVAFIKVSASTNSAEIDVTVYSDGSANRTIGPARNSELDGTPAMFLPGQPAVAQFLADLDAVGNVAAISSGQCPKSASFGTTTTVTAGGKTSGDLQCISSPTPAEIRLVEDCDTLTTGAPELTFDGGAPAFDGSAPAFDGSAPAFDGGGPAFDGAAPARDGG